MTSPAKVWSVDMLQSLPEDGNRYEIIGGELFVTPSPTRTHQRITYRLGHLLGAFLAEQHVNAEVFDVDADIEKDEHNLVQPDVLVIDMGRGDEQSEWPPLQSLLLAIEVLSPSTARRDRKEKRELYLGAGVEYWIVDPFGRLIERWLPGDVRPEILADTLQWRPQSARTALVIDIEQLFAEPGLA